NQDTAAAPILYATSDKYDSFSSSTSLSTVNTSPLASDSAHWTAFAIGNDGTLFFGGHSSFQQIVAYSKDGGKTWTIDSTHFTGMTGPNFAFSKTGNTYTVYFTTIYAAYDSSTGFSSWSQFGNAGLETHPNDGSVCIDPLNNNVVYMTTDQGLGASVNGGSVIKEIDDGITALQINGLVLDSTKTNGWVASKAGLRHVTDYSSSPVWSVPIFPNSDGAPYYSVALIGRDANSVYVGNNRVYRTTDGGSTWTMVFDAENPPYNFNEFTYPLLVDAINVNPYDTNMVIAGYTMQNGESQAGAFYSTDGGTNWSQLLCLSASIGEDVNATSLIFTHENDSSVAYIGVRYDSLISNAAARGRSIYRAVWNGDSWSVRQDMSSSYTSTHTDITASIYAMALSSSTDTLYAAGSDESGSNVKIYYKVLGGPDLWTELPTTGISTHAGNPAIASSNEIKAMAIGNDTLYCAIDNNIFIKDISSDTSWTLGCAYGVGDAINALYYDDLLVGTGTGLYGQHIAAPSTAVKNKSTLPDKYVLYQNYPDPFNPTTVINYQLPVVSNVTLSVYDILGRKVATLINAKQNAGVHIAVFDGASYSSGVYFYRIETNGSSETKKMLLLK
ncbi:MAG: T9SS type A sorting domain-containing protein, partial [Candidatus Kryptoniota bacterium]